jgi:hypothetical protein
MLLISVKRAQGLKEMMPEGSHSKAVFSPRAKRSVLDLVLSYYVYASSTHPRKLAQIVLLLFLCSRCHSNAGGKVSSYLQHSKSCCVGRNGRVVFLDVPPMVEFVKDLFIGSARQLQVSLLVLKSARFVHPQLELLLTLYLVVYSFLGTTGSQFLVKFCSPPILKIS